MFLTIYIESTLAMIKHTFIDKSCTIYKGSDKNTGLNPVCELNYGKTTSRALIYFNEEELVHLYEEKELGNLDNVRHILHLTNCMSQDGFPYDKDLNDGGLGVKERAVSFDVILFKLPKNFDAGRGFDRKSDFWTNSNRSISTKGCTWYNAQTNNPWSNPDFSGDTTDGVYSIDVLEDDLDAFRLSGASQYIIAIQHFDFGNENFKFDITDWLNDVIKTSANDSDAIGTINHGLGLAFAPKYERLGESHIEKSYYQKALFEYDKCGNEAVVTGYSKEVRVKTVDGLESQEYVGFFNDNTNTFFHPYVETICDNNIVDDRAQFYIGKTNRLYLYSIIDGEYRNLDNLPTCTIDDVEFPVKQARKGVYFAEITPLNFKATPNTIYYDNWSNLAYNGVAMPDMELEFVALPSGMYFQIGAGFPMKDNLVPAVSGIDDMEELPFNEIRRVIVDFRKKYSIDKKDILESAEYRIYINDGQKEITVIDYAPIEKTFMSNFFYVRTNEFVPGIYHVDIRVRANGEVRQYKDKLRFKIVSDVTEYYK